MDTLKSRASKTSKKGNAMKTHEKKSAMGTSHSALAMEVITGFLASALLVCTAGWWMLKNCREADRLVAEYGMKLKAQQNAAAKLENFLASR